MITFKAKKIKYYCPTSWSEVTFKQWKELNKTKNDLKIISILTGIPKRTIERISENSILKLSLAIGFIAKPISIEDYYSVSANVTGPWKKTGDKFISTFQDKMDNKFYFKCLAKVGIRSY